MSFSETLNRLHAAVFADPDADEPRLAFARHLEPVSPDQAEFIRLQVERHAADRRDHRVRSQPSAREREFLARYGTDWAQMIAPHGRAVFNIPPYEFNRGFVEMLHTDAGVFTSLGEKLLRLGPVRHLVLERDDTPLADVVNHPALRHLISLHLEGWELGNPGAKAIAESPHLNRLVKLGLRNNRIGEAGVDALAASAGLRRLLVIDLRDNPYPRATIAIDATVRDDDGRYHFEPTEVGQRLEAKYGPIRWLHPTNNEGADRYHLAEVADRGAS